ncbi:transcriptional regulator [Citrobacter koseri]|nr:transcriptional regulator [Citrobacter koseri]
MLPGCRKNIIIISKIPVIQTGLKEVVLGHFPAYELMYCRSVEELTLMQLRRSDVVITDLTGECKHPPRCLRAILRFIISIP